VTLIRICFVCFGRARTDITVTFSAFVNFFLQLYRFDHVTEFVVESLFQLDLIGNELLDLFDDMERRQTISGLWVVSPSWSWSRNGMKLQ
jgi:hypothetical protein